MTAPASTFVTYLWHYMLARFLYDELVRGHLSVTLLAVAVAILGFALRRRRRA
jgi:hypothetical protein